LSAENERFGIEGAGPLADAQRDTARFLFERGVPLEEIKTLAKDPGALHALAWRRMYGPSGTPMSLSDVAGKAGLTEEQVRTIVRALGFSDATTEFEMADDDVETLHLFAAASELLGEEQVVHLGRVIGSSMARIAEAAASASRVSYETPILEEGSYYDFLLVAEAIARDFFPQLAVLMDRIFRYHVLLVSGQRWGIDAEQSAMTLELAVGFADMVGFTEHAGGVSTKELARAVDDFEGRVTDAVVSAGGRVVKFIGDEVFFVFSDVAAACACARKLIGLASEEAIGDVRIGLSFGQVISRFGDIYGPVVNTAKRLVDVSPPGSILVTPDVAERAGASFTFERRDPVTVKGVDRPVDNLLLR
jgi:adenylate cyclase